MAIGRLVTKPRAAWRQVELSVFVAPREDCVLVDGNRLFQTHPQRLDSRLTCSERRQELLDPMGMQLGRQPLHESRTEVKDFTEKRGLSLSLTGVVSYSGTVTLIRCRFPSAPSSTAELAVFTLEHLQEAGWSITGLRLCPFQPLRPAGGPRHLVATGNHLESKEF